MDWSYVQEIIPRFVQAALVTLRLSAWGVSLSLLLGLAVALVTSYRVRPFDRLARAYIELSRNTPLLIQLFFLYYGLPKIGIHWDGFTCGVIALTFLGGSYMAEALRAGLQAVPRGQVESARAIGLKRAQVLWQVVLPQALAIALPALTANALFLVKETSVINAVSVAELLFVTKDIIGTDYMTNEALFMLLVSYLVLLLPLSWLAAWVEKRMRRAEYGGA
ncbi:MAG: amino acid ABC transporter permease [Lautropia mirabilis]|nr:amino acid ABC transporter permease [Lautropia mirabilis]